MKTDHVKDFNDTQAIAKANVVIFSFQDADNYIVYSPQLDVSGYGKTQKEALSSFDYCLAGFLDYSFKKETLYEELICLGWKLKKGTNNNLKQIKAPSWSDLIKKNQSLKVLLSEYNINTQQREVEFPV
jgi:hypothetical protein